MWVAFGDCGWAEVRHTGHRDCWPISLSGLLNRPLRSAHYDRELTGCGCCPWVLNYIASEQHWERGAGWLRRTPSWSNSDLCGASATDCTASSWKEVLDISTTTGKCREVSDSDVSRKCDFKGRSCWIDATAFKSQGVGSERIGLGVSRNHISWRNRVHCQTESRSISVLIYQRGPCWGRHSGLEGERGHWSSSRRVWNSASAITNWELEGGSYVGLLLVLAGKWVFKGESASYSINCTSKWVVREASSQIHQRRAGPTCKLELVRRKENSNLRVRKKSGLRGQSESVAIAWGHQSRVRCYCNTVYCAFGGCEGHACCNLSNIRSGSVIQKNLKRRTLSCSALQ